MLISAGWIVAGLILLVVGAEMLVRSGTRLAVQLGISPVIIGLTIVALGTSTPELAIGIDSVISGNGDLAIGNIAGTNVVNILLILGLSALISPLALRPATLWLDLPMIVVASALLLVMAWDGALTRTEGIVLVLVALAYTAAIVQVARRESYAVKASFAKGLPETPAPSDFRSTTTFNMIILVVSIVILVVSADWLVTGAVDLAHIWGVSDAFIGLTIVAVGTSAPELVTTIISTLKRERDIAIGNLLGSSVYNILFILGVTCAIPAETPVAQSLIDVDIPVMAAVAFVCIPIFVSGREISRIEGGLFVAAYVAYLSYLVVART